MEKINNKIIIVRFGEMMLKGKNLKDFIKKIKEHLREKLGGFSLSITYERGKAIIKEYDKKDETNIIEALNQIPGLHSYSIGYIIENDYSKIKKLSFEIIKKELPKSPAFKVEVKRIDKNLPYTSQEFSLKIATDILKQHDTLVPNLKNPEDILYIELRSNDALLYLTKVRLLGGKPSKTASRGICLLSGGIDSPVAAIEAIRQGVNLSLIHFESSPLTPIESIDKVLELAQVISSFILSGTINLYIVPFKELHEEILKKIPEQYIITIMRRMMYKITSEFAKQKKINIIFNGDSIGQVASQTLESMATIDNITPLTVVRPLATYDKEQVILLSKKYKTYDISIRPFSDCCTVYVPKSPATKPKLEKAIEYENNMNYNEIIERILPNIEILYINKDSETKISKYGLDLKEALINMRKSK